MYIVRQNTQVEQAELMLGRIAEGDRQAEQTLVDIYYRGLYFVLNRQTQNPTLSEDLAQDTFVIVLQKARINAIQNPAALTAFIRQTGINLLLGHIRKENRRDTQGVDDIDFHSPCDGLDLSRALHSDQMLQLTAQMFEELKTQRDRDLLRCYYVYDQGKPQICQQLKLSPEHFDRVLFRARQRLKQLIEDKLNDIPKTQSGKVANLLSMALTLGLIIEPVQAGSVTKFSDELVRETKFSQHQSDTRPHASGTNTVRQEDPELRWL
ncbi:sigma-70 family RNA polymerase sigma factor [Paraglaciecola sp.]|uniref:RNA polymerase sigma factor n=1 Tax=Paraglaciecola sp. TaxID=1920173 RepID=UPI0030F3740F